MPEEDVYRRLQRHLDRLPERFPPTASGIELRILERLFSGDAARIALDLSALPEPATVIHKRLRSEFTLEDLRARLKQMAARGLILRTGPRHAPRYGLLPFVVGIYERQLPWLTENLEREVLQYMEEGFGSALHSTKTTQMRTVPVNADLTPGRDVATYDDIRAFVRRSEGPFAVMECICRLGRRLVGHACQQTERREACLTFGMAAEGMVQTGAARFISRDEMLQLLDDADRDGLVLQPENTQDPLFVCCCCGCCCGVITTAKRLREPSKYFSTNYYAAANAETCEACGTCLLRCQMDAVSLESGRAVVSRSHCIGCGLCVATCPSESIALHRTERPRVPPKDTSALYVQLYRERYGVLGLAKALGRHVVGLKV